MKAGISTATLFGRMLNEDGVAYLNENKVKNTEIFLSSFCEYEEDFARLLKRSMGGINVNSVHVVNTQYEPQLYSAHPRALSDAYAFLDKVMTVANIVGARYYTFHGMLLLKKSFTGLNYPKVIEQTKAIADFCEARGVRLAYENVHWATYYQSGFFKRVGEQVPNMSGVLDIKQARLSGEPYQNYIDDMAGRISHAHISDVDADGKNRLPGAGAFDFDTLFKRLSDSGFDGCVLIEDYQSDYKELDELLRSLEFVNEKLYKLNLLTD